MLILFIYATRARLRKICVETLTTSAYNPLSSGIISTNMVLEPASLRKRIAKLDEIVDETTENEIRQSISDSFLRRSVNY